MSDYVPEEILINILSRLPVKTLLKFRCVSKTWNSLITSASFIAHHLNKTKNNDLLFLWDGLRYFLYPDKDFPNCHGEELDFPLEKLDLPSQGRPYTHKTLVGSCNGLFCIYQVYYVDILEGRFAHRVALWNPSIRKTLPIPAPSGIYFMPRSFHDEHYFGFGFDSITNDYKLVKILYLYPNDDFLDVEPIMPPLVAVYSLKSGCWTMLENDLKCVLRNYSRSALVNEVVHWAAISRSRTNGKLNVVVCFSLADEKFGEMIVPDCVVSTNNWDWIVTVFDGLLSLVASNSQMGHYSIWAMKEYGDAKSWTKLFNIEPLRGEVDRFAGFKKSGEVFQVFVQDHRKRELAFYSMNENGSCRIWGTEIWGKTFTVYVDSYMESLVLLNEAEASISLDDGATCNEASSTSKEHSSHVADLDKNKKEKEKKERKDMENPAIVDQENRVLEVDGSSAGGTSCTVIFEGNGTSRGYDFWCNEKETNGEE